MTQASWSLASRLTKLFAITTSALVIATTLISYLYVSNSTNQRIKALLVEELDEMRDKFLSVGPDPARLAAAAEEISANHKDTPLAWLILEHLQPSPLGPFGKPELFENSDFDTDRRLADSVQELSGDRRVMFRMLAEKPVRIDCVVDASEYLGEVRRFAVIASLLVLLTIAINFAVGRALVGRVSRTLSAVAESARHVADRGGSMRVDIQDAPQEIHEVVAALQEMLNKAQAEAERNRVFTASMAHELRSPIQNLMGETEVALITNRDAAEYRRVLGSHLQDLRELADAVDNLVTICSQPKGGIDQKTTRESFELADEARLRLARESGYASARGVKLNLEFHGDTRLYGDREGLLRAMRNLTANAIEWSDPGGEVDVRVLGNNGEVTVVVDDAGPGVPEELKERIFEAFFRGPQAKGRRIGYGLGLAIVRSAVDAQGGSIEVGRSPRGGARFCMRLPRSSGIPRADETPIPV